ncbi:2TM domain-containing protein [Flavobacterium sp. 7E]|nr:2TM domain-containing protein [Flavobacterium sp. 7E]
MIKMNQNSNKENQDLEIARKKVRKLKSFYMHFFIYMIGLTFFILKEYFKIRLNIFPLNQLNFFVMAVWTAAFLVTLVDTLVSFAFFGKKWEDRKLHNIMNTNNKTQKGK